jgi:hypothetical protein
MTNVNQLPTTFTLESHTKELFYANDQIRDLEQQLNDAVLINKMSNSHHEKLFENTANIIDLVGGLSKQVFDIEQQLEDQYTEAFIHTPELGKKLWYDHYEELHKPYTNLKNKCWRLFDAIDECFINANKSKPNNWDNRLDLENRAT